MERAYYSDPITDFVARDPDTILGRLSRGGAFDVTPLQREAWREEIEIMKYALVPYCNRGKVYFEYDIPRLGGRIDVLAVIDNVIFIIEFKVGSSEFVSSAIDQVYDYALDMKNFHETSHAATIAPILVATKADDKPFWVGTTLQEDKLLHPISVNAEMLAAAICNALDFADDEKIVVKDWERGRYSPTPTIIEAATALYGGHSVTEISRNDAGATNLSKTSETVDEVIQTAKRESRKAICFVTGVPGAGKTLVGLDIAARYNNGDLKSVFLSGNAALVNVLREALVRDEVQRQAEQGKSLTKKAALRVVKAFIQNVHNFRDDCLRDKDNPPRDCIALFDEAQRMWNRKQINKFMHRRKGIPDFNMSEPEFLISCLDRHIDWAVIVCLVGGGQEIKTGEAGIGGWIDALVEKYEHWDAYISSHLNDDEYAAGHALSKLRKRGKTVIKNELHLATSMRSFRAERVSTLVKQVLDSDADKARHTLNDIGKYPMVLTRNLRKAKAWLRDNARGSERYGMVVSSQAERLRPHAIDVRPRINPVHWFLEGKEDVRSSYYLEDVVTEFEVQGLEIDWACVTWDADFRYTSDGWEHWSFKGSRWNRIHKSENQVCQKNAYRVLLTRARQGMVIVIPEGDSNDPTRDKSYYDPTFDYLRGIGFQVV